MLLKSHIKDTNILISIICGVLASYSVWASKHYDDHIAIAATGRQTHVIWLARKIPFYA